MGGIKIKALKRARRDTLTFSFSLIRFGSFNSFGFATNAVIKVVSVSLTVNACGLLWDFNKMIQRISSTTAIKKSKSSVGAKVGGLVLSTGNAT